MTNTNTFSTAQVQAVAKLANIPVEEQQAQELATAFNQTLEVVNQLQEIDVKNVEQTHQVTGLENVWREDQVDKHKMFTQQQALANAASTHNGYIVVDRIIDQD